MVCITGGWGWRAQICCLHPQVDKNVQSHCGHGNWIGKAKWLEWAFQTWILLVQCMVGTGTRMRKYSVGWGAWVKSKSQCGMAWKNGHGECGQVNWTISAHNHNQLTIFYTSGYYAPLASMSKASKTPASHQPTLKASTWVKASMAGQVKEVPLSSNPPMPSQRASTCSQQLLMVIEVEHSVTHHPSTITHQSIQLHCLLHPILLTQKLILVIKISTLSSYTILMQSKDAPRRKWRKYTV